MVLCSIVTPEGYNTGCWHRLSSNRDLKIVFGRVYILYIILWSGFLKILIFIIGAVQNFCHSWLIRVKMTKKLQFQRKLEKIWGNKPFAWRTARFKYFLILFTRGNLLFLLFNFYFKWSAKMDISWENLEDERIQLNLFSSFSKKLIRNENKTGIT